MPKVQRRILSCQRKLHPEQLLAKKQTLKFVDASFRWHDMRCVMSQSVAAYSVMPAEAGTQRGY